jgi:hypothetical protein
VYAALKPELDAFAALRQVARGYCPDCGRGDAAPTVDDWEQQRQRADEAEGRLAHLQESSEAVGRYLTRTVDERNQLRATLARAREAAAWIRRNYPALTQANGRLTAALEQPAARPTATQATDGKCSPDASETEPNTWTEPTHPHPCTATIKGRATPGGRQVQCTREAGHPENHVGPKQGSNGRVLWTDHNAGAVPHRRAGGQRSA